MPGDRKSAIEVVGRIYLSKFSQASNKCTRMLYYRDLTIRRLNQSY